MIIKIYIIRCFMLMLSPHSFPPSTLAFLLPVLANFFFSPKFFRSVHLVHRRETSLWLPWKWIPLVDPCLMEGFHGMSFSFFYFFNPMCLYSFNMRASVTCVFIPSCLPKEVHTSREGEVMHQQQVQFMTCWFCWFSFLALCWEFYEAFNNIL